VTTAAKPPAAAFRARVIATVRRIPAGRLATYGDVAAAAGFPRAWRAVGSVMRETRDPSVPCHRVIAAGGALGGFGSNLHLKRELLRAEGHIVGVNRVRGFEAVRWLGATKRDTGPRSAEPRR
jgi:methylated-DNA-[protein]-cysteine S-methyltransferase